MTPPHIAMTSYVRLLGACVVLIGLMPGGARAGDFEEPGTRVREQPDTRWELDTSVSGRRYAIRGPVPGGAEVDGMGERLRVELVSFLTPLRDDGAPYSLQSFLQRANSFAIDVDAGHFATDNPQGFMPRTDWDASVGGGVDFYARRWLDLFASTSYDYDALRDVGVSQKTHSFSGSGGAGVRAGDTLVRASYYAAWQQTSGASLPLRQGVQLSAFTALDRRFAARLFGETIPQGGEGQVSLEYFRGQNLGIFAAALAGKGQFYRTGAAVTRYVGTAGLAGWLDSTTGLVAQYSLTIEDQLSAQMLTATDVITGYHQVTHALLLQLYLRYP